MGYVQSPADLKRLVGQQVAQGRAASEADFIAEPMRLYAEYRFLAVPDDHAASRNLRSSRSRLARPYIWRLRVFRRLIWPSTGPLLQSSVRAARTAS